LHIIIAVENCRKNMAETEKIEKLAKGRKKGR